jgi:DNA polymerase-3 subunit epsilon
MKLFFDTETTGMVEFKKPHTDPSQPDLLQLAFILDDDDGNTIESFCAILFDEAYGEIHEKALAVHGISKEKARMFGIPALEGLATFAHVWGKARMLIAHNISFDKKIMKIAFHRSSSLSHPEETLIEYCTMRTATPILKLPGKFGHKWPTLDEAYRVLVDPEGFEGAHDALNDVKACRAVYYKLQELKG